MEGTIAYSSLKPSWLRRTLRSIVFLSTKKKIRLDDSVVEQGQEGLDPHGRTPAQKPGFVAPSFRLLVANIPHAGPLCGTGLPSPAWKRSDLLDACWLVPSKYDAA